MTHPSRPAGRRYRGEGDSVTFCVTSPEEAAEVSAISLPTARRPVALVAAIDAFLDRFRDDPGTRATYTETLRRLRENADDQLPGRRAHPGALRADDDPLGPGRREHLEQAPVGAHLVHRRLPPPGLADHRSRDKAIPRARLERLFTDDRNPLRERVLWRMLYETCAGAVEILGLDVPDLDMAFRRALVTEKGGDRAYVHWETPTCCPGC
nr:hypothetical protein GCM10020063_031530 [Dactylosporangium thailandense]